MNKEDQRKYGPFRFIRMLRDAHNEELLLIKNFAEIKLKLNSTIENSCNLFLKIKDGELRSEISSHVKLKRIITSPAMIGKSFSRFYSNENKETDPKKKIRDKYHITLWNRIKNIPSNMRNFVVKGPITVHKMLPIFNIMFFGVATGVLIATTTIVSVGVWVANRNEHWKELMANKIGEQITKETGIGITFQNVKGSWKEGTLKLGKVNIKRDPFDSVSINQNVSAILLDIEEISVKISLIWWLQGHGFIEKLHARNITGDIFSEHLIWDTKNLNIVREHKRGDFVIEDLKLSDVNVNLHQIAQNRPLRVQIHSIDCGKVRKQWLLRDLLLSHSAYGIFDGSLFSLTRKQSNGDEVSSVLKIDGLNFDVISESVTGPLSWIKEGTFDVNVVMNFNKFNSFENLWSYQNTKSGYYVEEKLEHFEPIEFDVKLKLNNLRARLPRGNNHQLHKNLVNPIVAYINTNYESIPLSFRILLNEADFNGAKFPYETELWEALSIGVTRELVSLVKNQKSASTTQKSILMVIKGVQRGIYFLNQQIEDYYDPLLSEPSDENLDHLYIL